MKCTEKTRASLADPSISDADFASLATHFEDCSACRELAENQFQSEWTQSSFHEPLKEARASDLEYPVYDSRIDWEAVTQAAIGDEATVPSDPSDLLGAATHPELLGRIGRYDVEGVLGSGGTGVVFRAFDKDLHRVVAIKVLNRSLATNAAARQRFAREAQAAAAVLHPNVLPIHNVEPEAETPFLVMQYVPGQSLQARIERDGVLDVEDVLRIGKQTAEALAAAHQQGLIHRDVKPANILLESETDRAVLGDFGLARTADDASLTRTGIVAGTPHYMSPEQANGESIGPASDLFSLGGVIYTMLAGRPPFRADTAMGVLHCVCTKKQDKLTGLNNRVPRELSDLVCKLLSKKPQDRFGNATEVAKQLESLLARYQQGKLRLASGQPKLPSTWNRNWVVISVAVLLVCSLAAWWNRGAIRNLAGYPIVSSRQQEIKQFMSEMSGPIQQSRNAGASVPEPGKPSTGEWNHRGVQRDRMEPEPTSPAKFADAAALGLPYPSQGLPGPSVYSGLPPLGAASPGAPVLPPTAFFQEAGGISTSSDQLPDLMDKAVNGIPEASNSPWQEWDQEINSLSQAIEQYEQPRGYERTLGESAGVAPLDQWTSESQALMQVLESLMKENESVPGK